MLLRELVTPRPAPETPAEPTAVVVPPAIERIITTALDVRPGHRYPDISVMVNDMWAAHTVLAEPESRPRPVKPPVQSHRRARPRRSHSARGIAAAVATAAIVAAVGWLALSDGIASRVRARITRPAMSAVPVDQSATPPSVAPVPAMAVPMASSPSLAREETPAHASTGQGHPDPAAAPRPAPVAPVAERQEPSAPGVVHDRPRPAEARAPVTQPARVDSLGDTRDGSAAIDWLLKPRR